MADHTTDGAAAATGGGGNPEATTYRPETQDQLVDLMTWAASADAPLDLGGAGSKRALGRPMQTQAGVALTAFSGIQLYEPEELILKAGAGTPMDQLVAELAKNGQAFAFEPPDLAPLLGTQAGQGTLGGTVACNLAGPRRVKAGAARDHFLGYTGVSGRGEVYKSGGRVVKNVTGYDLCKLMAGSYGTLTAMTDITMKVLPASEATRTVILTGLDTGAAVRALTAGLTSSFEVSGAAHLPAAIASVSRVSEVAKAHTSVTALRLEGPPKSVEHRARKVAEVVQGFGTTRELHDEASAALWADIRDVRPFVGMADTAVWRISVPPAQGPDVAARLALLDTRAQYYLDWGGGLIWLAVPEGSDAFAEGVRGAVQPTGGHATLIKAAEQVRAQVPVFQPQDAGLAALTRNLKDGFDPKRLLNPGRMYAGV
jgi:glycolate oxidase FAD binding subunit